MASHRRHRRQSAKLQPKFVSLYCVVETLPNHTYKIEHFGQISVHNEVCSKPDWASPDAVGQALISLLEPRRQPVARGQVRQVQDS